VEDLDEDAVEACTVAAVAVPRRAINSRATAHAATLGVAVITEIAIMAIGVAVLSLVVGDTIRAPEARHIAVVGKATHIPTFPVVGDTMVAAGVLVPERVLWAHRASWPAPRVVGRRMKIGGTLLTLRLLVSRFWISLGLGAQLERQNVK
jgi:hypothetical protein